MLVTLEFTCRVGTRWEHPPFNTREAKGKKGVVAACVRSAPTEASNLILAYRFRWHEVGSVLKARKPYAYLRCEANLQKGQLLKVVG